MLTLMAIESDSARVKLSELYENHKYFFLSVALKYTNGNKETAEDVIHSAFISLMEHQEKIEKLDSRELRNYCVIIVKNKCIDILRKEKRISDTPVDEYYDLQSDEPPIESKVIRTEEYAMIKRMLSMLDDESRNILEMKYVMQMSYKEIAQETGLTAKHVDTKIMRAKAKIRKKLEKEVQDG